MRQKLADLINVIFGFRKFLIMLFLYTVGVVFRVKDLISGAELVDLFKATTLAFMGANGVEHLVSVAKDYVNNKSTGDDLIPPADQEADDAKAEAGATNG